MVRASPDHTAAGSGFRRFCDLALRKTDDAAARARRRPCPAMPPAATINDVTLPVPGARPLPAALAMPARPRRAGVLVLHEAFGLNDDMRRIAWRFAAAGYPTLAPDFLDGLGPMP